MTCPECRDSGLVAFDRLVEFKEWGTGQPRQGRVMEAFRCACPAGRKVSDDFRLAPRHLRLVPDRKDW